MIFVSAVAALVPVGSCYFGRWYLDRARTEPPWMFPVLSVLGGLGGLVFALYAGPALEQWMSGRELEGDSRFFAEVLTAPALEELGKAFVLLPLLWTRWLRSPVDGLFYGFAAGSGFAVVENFVYFTQAFEMGGGVVWVAEVAQRLGPSIVIHGGATAIIGAYLGGAKWGGRLGTRVFLPVSGWFIAVAVHGGWNILIGLGGEGNAHIYTSLAYVLLAVLTIGLLGGLYLALQLESQMLKSELASEIEDGYISSSEVNMMADHIRRRSNKWLPRGALRTQFVRNARSLAYALKKSRERGFEGETTEHHRTLIQSSRGTEPKRPSVSDSSPSEDA